ncbi:hydantoinase/carbamoylase family amidase [Agrobacterium sp. NPDC089420]|uniref:hydantoinase/carbamoylase family amidase n=1 Tax=Agrobacterium sp. NPDC089420 TaxID=3363918 RepID=UPI00384CA697
MIEIDGDAVIETLRTLASFGRDGNGVCRTALSNADMAARHWFAGEMSNAGLDVRMDAVGNVYGKAPVAKKTVLIGSHSDSVPTGGWLDGTLGLAYGLEIARSWSKVHPNSNVGIDLINFSDEEGTFLSCLGSSWFCGKLTSLPDAFVSAKRGTDLPVESDIKLDPLRHRAFFEAHIEQGPRMEVSGLSVGVVSGIFGMRRYVVRFQGRADHAGTTPIALRRDAARILFHFGHILPDRFRFFGSSDSVWNLGRAEFFPGAVNVVAEDAELLLEFRDLNPLALDRLSAALLELVTEMNGEDGVLISCDEVSRLAPIALDADLQNLITNSAISHGVSPMRLPSGAIHDSMILAQSVPTAMMFVPSINGRSHAPEEDTKIEDIKLGAKVLAHAVYSCVHSI